MVAGALAIDDVHMLGQNGRAGTGWVAGVAGLLAVVLLTAVGVAALRTDTASAETVLLRGADARLELADGTSRPAVEGERVPRGATVLAGRTGAVLETREREVHLGGATAVTVVDGMRQVLREGFVLADASNAPGLELETAAGTVTASDDSLVRVDGGPLVRVGVLRGEAAAVRAAGRRATAQVPTYFQVQVPAGGLPGDVTPFVLTPGDVYERELAADLVAADDALNALASRLAVDPTVAGVVLNALRTQLPAAPAAPSALPGSEPLGFLIAQAAAEPADPAAAYDAVRALRAAGGSWGVVAAIVDAEVGRVGAALNALLDPGTVPVLAGQPLDLDAVLDPSGPGAADAPAPSGPAPAPPASSQGEGRDEGTTGSGSGGGGGASPSPSPSPTTGPTDPITDVVDEVVETVMELVSPSPSPSPSSPVPVIGAGAVGQLPLPLHR